MTLDEIIQGNNDAIRSKTQPDSITPFDEADRLDAIARFAAAACPFSAIVVELPGGTCRVTDPRMKGWDVYSIEAGGYFLFSDRGDFLKVKADEFIDFSSGILALGSTVSIQLKLW